ncbi:c-type cytochrome domain-containing protein [Planctomicrobium sp. SH527]|uniref:WD40 domain-containing protein n=1 Tax=Planctomicrobium sp. SH527 TaxID=3448123 RepID=UPI003F5B57E5
MVQKPCLASFQRSAGFSLGTLVKNVVRTGLLPIALFGGVAFGAEEKKEANAEKVTFVDHVLPIFRAKCGSCHNASDKRGGLAVDNFAALMAGGSSGDVIEPGDAGNSYLFSLITHASEPKMPPNADKLAAPELAIIEKWINLGAPENSGSKVAIKKKPNLAKIEVTNTRPAEVAIPTRYFGDPPVVPKNATAATALATSPWASVAAMSGHRQVVLFNSNTFDWLGVLPYPEGQPQIIKFSRDGALVMVGGGRGGLSGRVVVYDVKTGERKIEVGDEYDEVLAADLSPNLSLIALGGPKKMLRIYSTETGELVSENKKHTDWITAIEFSPDGVLLASGDRSNGVVVWEAGTGSLFYDLQAHKGSINDISWRPDSNVVASASSDGTIKLWEMQNGGLVKSWDAHPGGVTAMDFTREGQIVSIGRDRVSRLWNGDGAKVRDFPATPDIGMEIAYDAETKRLIVGDWSGHVSVFNADDAAQISRFKTNPPTVPMQVADVQQKIGALNSQIATHEKAIAGVRAQMGERQKVVAVEQAKVAQLTEALAKVTAQRAALEKGVLDQTAATAAAEKAVAETQAGLTKTAADLKVQADERARLEKAFAELKEKAGKVAASIATLTPAVAEAKTTTENLNKAAAPTAEEAAAIESNEDVKKAVAERQAAATAAQQAQAKLEASLATETAALQAIQAEAATLKQAAEKQAPLLAAAQSAHAASMKAVQDAQAAVAASKAAVDNGQKQVATVKAAEQAAGKQVADSQAALKAATDRAAATEAEQKILNDADAAIKGIQGQKAGLDASLERLKKIQNELTTAQANS